MPRIAKRATVYILTAAYALAAGAAGAMIGIAFAGAAGIL